ncbi:MAG TPA: glycosyltransferase family 9 protein [Ignavibacteriaceae bacterium]|nr:glycosyltransferase family 9 protein [Ignavibacteriaceae bacterium]
MPLTEKILIIQTAFIGDAILTLPMIQKLKEIYPESLIDVVSNPVTSEIFSASPYVNEVIILDKRKEHKSIFSTYKFSKGIKEKKYAKLFSPHRSFRTSLIVLLSDIIETYGFDNSSIFHVYKYVIPYNYNAHEVQRNLDLINYKYDENNWRIKPELVIQNSYKEKVAQFIKDNHLNKNLIAVAPGSIWNTKKYPIEYFEKIIETLNKKGFKIILIGGENDKEVCTNLANINKENIISCSGKLSLLESIEILKKVRLLISNDSAPTHMGMCSDIPVLTLYCSTTFDFGFYPYNAKSSYLSYDDLFCKPCGIHGYDKCPVNTFDCGYLLKPEIVISQIEKMLND